MGDASAAEVFSDAQLRHILRQVLGEQECQLVRCDVAPAAEGLTGFLGDHFRATLLVRKAGVGAGDVTPLRLFVKAMPRKNQNKASMIDESNFFRRERTCFQLFQSVGGDDGPNPWRTKAYIYTDSLLVMPDLTTLGYSQQHYLSTLDLAHARVVAAAVARFHAAFTGLAADRSRALQRPYSFLEEHGHIMGDPGFCDSPWLRACAKLSADLLDAFSDKYNKQNIPGLEQKLFKLYVEACDSIVEHEDTLNVIVHKDLWMNNLMFKYEGDVPTNALLIDFQCMHFGPPAFDVNVFLYLTTSRSFRENHEAEIYRHYFSVFMDSLNDAGKEWVKELGYTFEEFLLWCEKSRKFALVQAIAIFPYVLMAPAAAERNFDDPDTFDAYFFDDRSPPVLEYARTCDEYRQRQVDVTEEFVEKFILNSCQD